MIPLPAPNMVQQCSLPFVEDTISVTSGTPSSKRKGKKRQRDKAIQPSFWMCQVSRASELWLHRRYNLSFAQYYALASRQHHACAACSEHKPLNVDHDHQTGQVRGLVCSGCNNLVGMLEGFPEYARLYHKKYLPVLAYLKKYNAMRSEAAA